MRFGLQHLRRVPPAVEAAAWLTLAWLALDVLPGRLYRRLLPSAAAASNKTTGRTSGLPPRSSAANSTATVAWAVERVSRAMPFRSVCFHRGIAAHWMLRSRGVPSTLHYGVARNAADRGLRAHVWVSSNGKDVVGGAARQDFQEIAQFQRNLMRDYALKATQ